MWEFFIRNNKFAYLFLVALVGLGIYSLLSIPRESAPEVIIPIGIVTTVLPGAPAADIETLVTNEIERGLSSLENVKKVTSTSREGASTVVVEFLANADVAESIQDLKDEVDLIKPDLPSEANDPVIGEVNFQDEPVLTVALAADLTDIEFASLSTELERELESVSGVSRVEFSGVRDREVTVIVNQDALERFSLGLTDVTNALRNANQTFPIGQIINNGIAYNVAFEGDIVNSDEIPNVGIATRGGQPVFIRDVAVVEDGLSPARSLSRLSLAGEPSVNSISFNLFKQSGGDVTRIVASAQDKIKELQEPGEILFNVESSTILDAGAEIKTDLIRLTTSGLQTVFLVVLLLVVAIGWREGLLAGMAIPLSFLFGFIGLYFSDNSINFLSLFSLILGIGILVDSAIVMIEGINRRMKDDPTIDKREAAIQTIREFSAPLISGTLTTVSMFAGLFIVSGVIGQFIFSIPFTLIFLLFASMFVALAILPLLAAVFLKRRSESELEKKQLEKARQLEVLYRTKLESYLNSSDKQNKFLAIIAGALVGSLLLTVDVLAAAVGGLVMYALTSWRLQSQSMGVLTEKIFKSVLVVTVLIFASGIISALFSVGLHLVLSAVFGLAIAILLAYGLWRAGNWIFTVEVRKRIGYILFGLYSIIVSFAIGFGISQVLPTFSPVSVVFFEQSDVDFIIVEIENPEGTVKEVTDIDVRRVEELLYDESDFASFTVTVGSGSAFGNGGSGEKFANIFVNLKKDRARTSTEIVEDLRKQVAIIKDVKVTVNQPSDGPPTGAAIIVKFLGEDLDEIVKLSNEAARVFRSIPDTVNVETSTNNNNTEFVLELDKAKATSLGVSPFLVSQVARTAVFGSDATSLTTLKEDIDVVVKLNMNSDDNVTTDSSNITTIDALERISIPTQNGPVPLSTLVLVKLRESSSVIQHESGKRVVQVTADVSENGNARDIQAKALDKIQNEIDIPDGVEISTGGGETDESNQAFMEMLLALVVGVLLMVGVLTLQFNSYLHTRHVLSILPYSLIGIMFGLAVTMNPLSFPSIMGFIALSGIVVNNSILLIDMMNQTRKKFPAKSLQDVVLDSASSRLRPILLTTVTTVIGMIPLTYAGDLWSPLAYAVMFGLVFSVFITLLLIPITYLRKPGKIET